MEDRSFDIGPIRPPSEADSLLLQITSGCTWNKCRFCTVYRGQQFHIIKPDQIKHNIDNMAYFRDLIYSCAGDDGVVDREKLIPHLEKMNGSELQCFYMVYNWLGNGGRNVFLQDGNSIALMPEKLADVLSYLRDKFPSVRRITTYGRAETLSRYSVEQLEMLKKSGLDRIHTGFESGSDNILKMINKGLTQEQQIMAGKKTMEAGIELSVYFMPGIGGKRYSRENSEQTAYVVNQIKPDFVRIRTFVLPLESEMHDMMLSGEFTECTDIEKLHEIRDMISDITAPDVNIVSDHITNLVGSINGSIGRDKDFLLEQADQVLGLPAIEQRTYQLARRHGIVENYAQFLQIPADRRRQISDRAEEYDSDELFENHLNEILRMYI